MFEELEIKNQQVNENVPDGTYVAELINVISKEEDTKFGKRMTTRLVFKIITPPFEGNIISKKMFWAKSGSITQNSYLGKTLKEISGKDKFVVKENIGKKMYIKIINKNVNGKIYSNIDNIMSIPSIPQPEIANSNSNNNSTTGNVIKENNALKDQKQNLNDELSLDELL